MKKRDLDFDLTFLRFLETTQGCSSSEALVAAFSTLVDHFGYDRFSISDMTGATTDERESQFSLVHNYPEEWLTRYRELHYVDADPVYLKGLRQTHPFTWTEAQLEARHPKSIRVMDEAAEFGLRAGVGFTLPQPRGRLVGFGLSSSHRSPRSDPSALRTLRLAGFSLRAVLDDIGRPRPSSILSLTPRETEVLQWISLGSSETDIAETLGLNDVHVRRFCKTAGSKLGTNTLAYAVAKALRLGLIT